METKTTTFHTQDAHVFTWSWIGMGTVLISRGLASGPLPDILAHAQQRNWINVIRMIHCMSMLHIAAFVSRT